MNDPAIFREHLNSTFVVDDGGTRVPLTLAEVTDIPAAPGFRQFSLFFHGPANHVLSQAIHTFHHDVLGPLEMFIVPVVGSTRERIVYQAAFNLLAPE